MSGREVREYTNLSDPKGMYVFMYAYMYVCKYICMYVYAIYLIKFKYLRKTRILEFWLHLFIVVIKW